MEPEELFVKRFSELINSGNYTLEDISCAIGIKSKGTISKYLSGNIKNIKRSQIVKIANLFNVSPAWLAGFTDYKYDEINIHSKYDTGTIQFLDNYNKLNELGKQTANIYVEGLTEIAKYTEKKTDIHEA